MLSFVHDDDGTFPTFKVSEFTKFSDSCRQTLVLFERASDGESCTSEGESALQTRVEAVNEACCERDGENIYTKGEPPIKL
jgi:hypothetical protein